MKQPGILMALIFIASRACQINLALLAAFRYLHSFSLIRIETGAQTPPPGEIQPSVHTSAEELNEMTSMDTVCRHIEVHSDAYLNDLKQPVVLPNIAAHGIGIRRTAALAAQMKEEAASQAIFHETQGVSAVNAEFKSAPERLLLFYNHYDIQPPESLEMWITQPSESVEKDTHLYGRSIGYNKGNPVAAYRPSSCCAERTAVTIKFIIEGEEEIGNSISAPSNMPQPSPFLWTRSRVRNPHV